MNIEERLAGGDLGKKMAKTHLKHQFITAYLFWENGVVDFGPYSCSPEGFRFWSAAVTMVNHAMPTVEWCYNG